MGYWRRDCSESVIVLTFLARTCQVDLPAPDELDTRMFRGLPIMRKAAARQHMSLLCSSPAAPAQSGRAAWSLT